MGRGGCELGDAQTHTHTCAKKSCSHFVLRQRQLGEICSSSSCYKYDDHGDDQQSEQG